jgi:hypothetical protein
MSSNFSGVSGPVWWPDNNCEIEVEVGAFTEREALEIAAEQICIAEYKRPSWRDRDRLRDDDVISVYISFSYDVPGTLMHARLHLEPSATASPGKPKTPLRAPTPEELAEANA